MVFTICLVLACGGCIFLVNKTKGYRYQKTTLNIRKTYWDQLKSRDMSITEFIDNAIRKELDVIDKSEEWIRSEIEKQNMILNDLQQMLKERAEEKQRQLLQANKHQFEYEKFCSFLENPIHYNTKEANREYNTNIRNYKHFEELQTKHKNNKFTVKDFMELKEAW